MKRFFIGIVLVVLLGIVGFLYRSAVERPSEPVACPLDALVCPDGISVSRTGLSCTFPACPPPNVSLADAGIAYAVPAGFAAAPLFDVASVATYEQPIASSTEANSIDIRRYAIAASSTALATIQQTAVGGASGLPASSPASFTSTEISTHRFTVIGIERFEGVIDTAYYLARTNDVLRFDAIDRGADWTNSNLDVASLPAHAGLLKLLSTLQGQ